MQLNEYQRTAMAVSTPPIVGGHICIEYASLALAGKAGELANIVKLKWRGQALADEMGDVLWYLALMAEQLGTTLERVAQLNIEKLERRNAEKDR